MLATNILLSGNNYRKIQLLFNFMCMGMVAESTFFGIQSEYCLKPVEEFWIQSREKALSKLRQKTEVVVLGKCHFRMSINVCTVLETGYIMIYDF